MKRQNYREKIKYFFDRSLTRSPWTLILMLFSAMMTIIMALGTVAFLVSKDGGWMYHVWTSLMHTLEAGALADDSTNNLAYLLMMFLATMCGIFLTSVLIGIITTGFESKLDSLKKGASVVQIKGQTTIIGFNNNIYTLLSELIEANRSLPKGYIVVLGDIPKEEMEDAISAHITKTYNTEIICRSGLLYEQHSFRLCSAENSRSIIINTVDDAHTIKILLALSTYLKTVTPLDPALHFVASIQDPDNIDPARIAGQNRATIVYSRDMIARIIVNTCRQHGLSSVLSELFGFNGDEMYVESIPELVGKTFGEALLLFENAILVGIINENGGILNPPMNTVITDRDKLVVLEQDEHTYSLCHQTSYDRAAIVESPAVSALSKKDMVILGSNSKLPIILREYDQFVSPGTHVTVVDEDLDPGRIGTYDNLEITVCKQPITRKFLQQITENDATNLLLLNDDSHNTEESDSKTLMNLLLLRDIADKTERTFSITTEMHHAENQKLADCTRVDDFVIGSNFSRLLMAQISECPELTPLINEFLNESGSELYIKPAAGYVKAGVAVDMYTLTVSAAEKGEIFFGYRLVRQDGIDMVINPKKNTSVTFTENDQIIVISEN